MPRVFDPAPRIARARRICPSIRPASECESQVVDAWLSGRPAPRLGLDAGCGFQYGLISQYRGRLRAVGLDMSPGLLRRNRDIAYAVCGDCQRLPFADASLDFILCRDVIEHVPRPADMLKEFVRVLRPGGLAVITTVNTHNPGMWSIRLTPRWLRTRVRAASYGDELGENAPTFHRANEPSKLHRMMTAAGLRIVGSAHWPAFMWYFLFSPPLFYGFAVTNRLLALLGLERLYGGLMIAGTKPADAA